MKQEKYYLSGKQALDLRGLGHHLKPTAMVGREGLTPAVREALEAVLAAHELVKVKIQEGCPLERAEAAEQLAAGSGAKIVQIIGRMILFYRPKPPEKRAPASRSEAAGCATRGCKRAAGAPRPVGGRSNKAAAQRNKKAAIQRGGRPTRGTAGKGSARRQQGRTSGKR